MEISDLPPVVNLPLSPAYILGMVNLRGKVMPVVDISECCEKPLVYSTNRWMVVVEADNEEYAFLCDGVPQLAEDSSGELIDPVEFMTRHRIGAC